MSLITDLLTPEAHRDPYVWGAALLGHAWLGLGFSMILMEHLPPVWAAAVASILYLILWEGAHLRKALRRGDRVVPAVADGALDAVGVAFGCFAAAFAVMDLTGLAKAAWLALLVVGAVGYWRRS